VEYNSPGSRTKYTRNAYQHEEQGDQHRQVQAGRRLHRDLPAEHDDVPAHHVQHDGGEQRERRDGDAETDRARDHRQREHVVAHLAAEHGVRRAERRPVQELEHAKPAACGAHAEQQRQAERRRQGQAAQQPGHVHGGGPGADLDDQRVRDEAALGDPQVGIKEREYGAANRHAEHRLGHQPGCEHALVTQGLEPEPFGGERDQIGEEQEEGEQEDQHDEAQATPPTRRQTGYA